MEDYSGIFLIALFSASAVFGPKGALSQGIGLNLGFLGASPKTALGWETMLVTAAVVLSLRQNGLDCKLTS